MRFDHFARTLGQAFASAMAEGGKFNFGSEAVAGVPLAELDYSGDAPTRVKVSLSRKDRVRVVKGDTFAVTIDGDAEASDAMRFARGERSLRIARRHGASGSAEVTVTLPALEAIAIGGSGYVEAEELGGDASIRIGGSGEVAVASFSGEALSAKIGGSGRIAIAGSTGRLDLAIGGSGNFEGEHLEVETASIRIGGSGAVEISSDGFVDVKIGGSGDILVHGNARCSVKAGGSGKLRCVPRGGNSGPMDEAA